MAETVKEKSKGKAKPSNLIAGATGDWGVQTMLPVYSNRHFLS